MKIGALISGRKDSVAAALKASEKNELVCLITIKSKNPESYMFHVPNIELVKLQAEAMELPLVFLETKGVKEEELKDLKHAIEIAKEKYKIQGLASGAIASNYQKERIGKICEELNLKSITPLWSINSELYLREVLRDFEVIIVGVAADGLNEKDLGEKFDLAFLEKMNKLNVNSVGEGGEFETFVLDCLLFKKKIEIEKAEKNMENERTGIYVIKEAKLVEKQ